MKCVTLPERRILRGKVPHVAPECHIQVLTKADVDDEMREQRFLRESWQASYADKGFGAFRGDLADRIFLDHWAPERVADYLAEKAATWPAENFEPEIAYWRGKAKGDRVCDACRRILRPAPPCECGCQTLRPGILAAGLGPVLAPTEDEGRRAPLRDSGEERPEILVPPKHASTGSALALGAGQLFTTLGGEGSDDGDGLPW